MRVAMEYEAARGRQVYDIHDKNLGYDITKLDLNSGEATWYSLTTAVPAVPMLEMTFMSSGPCAKP
jgi:hypothetical protein